MYKIYKLPFLPRFVKKVVNAAGLFPARRSAGEFRHSDIIYFAHALDIYRTSPMCAHVFTQKSEEATASSASLLATPLLVSGFIYLVGC